MIARIYSIKNYIDHIDAVKQSVKEAGFDIIHETKRSLSFCEPGKLQEELKGSALEKFEKSIDELTASLKQIHSDDLEGYVPGAPEIHI